MEVWCRVVVLGLAWVSGMALALVSEWVSVLERQAARGWAVVLELVSGQAQAPHEGFPLVWGHVEHKQKESGLQLTNQPNSASHLAPKARLCASSLQKIP